MTRHREKKKLRLGGQTEIRLFIAMVIMVGCWSIFSAGMADYVCLFGVNLWAGLCVKFREHPQSNGEYEREMMKTGQKEV